MFKRILPGKCPTYNIAQFETTMDRLTLERTVEQLFQRKLVTDKYKPTFYNFIHLRASCDAVLTIGPDPNAPSTGACDARSLIVQLDYRSLSHRPDLEALFIPCLQSIYACFNEETQAVLRYLDPPRPHPHCA